MTSSPYELMPAPYNRSEAENMIPNWKIDPKVKKIETQNKKILKLNK